MKLQNNESKLKTIINISPIIAKDEVLLEKHYPDRYVKEVIGYNILMEGHLNVNNVEGLFELIFKSENYNLIYSDYIYYDNIIKSVSIKRDGYYFKYKVEMYSKKRKDYMGGCEYSHCDNKLIFQEIDQLQRQCVIANTMIESNEDKQPLIEVIDELKSEISRLVDDWNNKNISQELKINKPVFNKTIKQDK